MTAVEDAIREITASIWETLFTLPLDRGEPGLVVAEPTVTGCVTIDGAWTGAVILRCDRQLATSLSAELFQSADPQPADVRDTLGELTNMLAGNIKALLPEPSRISLPAVALGGDYDLSVVGTTELLTVPFRCGSGSFTVTVLEGREGAA